MAATQIPASRIKDDEITDADIAAANKDGAAGTASLRTLGTGAAQACAGNDARLSNARTPTAHASTHSRGGSDPITENFIRHSTEFFTTAAAQNFMAGVAINAGTMTTFASLPKHPGCVVLTGVNTGSGYSLLSAANGLRISGGEQYDVYFRTSSVAFTNITLRFGFHDTVTASDAVDGCYFEMATNGNLIGKTSSNSSRTSTATLATLSAATWYHGRITVNSDATSVNFAIFSESGSSLGSADVTTNIPTAAGRECGVGIVATSSLGSSLELVVLDRIDISFAAVRGAG